jgi:hypothetical protein
MQEAAVGTARPRTPDSPAEDAVFRRMDPEALAKVRQFQASPLLDDGRINVIALDPIADRLGERWETRREQVYEHLERALNRKLGPTDFFLRVSDTVYLVAQPSAGKFGAQALCVRALDEVVAYFLGPGPRQDVQVHKVTDLSPHQIVTVPVDALLAAEGEKRETRTLAAYKDAKDDPTLLSPARWSPFVASNGVEVRVSCSLEPVFEVKRHTRIGYRLHRRVLDTATETPLSLQQLSHLSRGDLLRIDMATIARGMARLAAQEDHEHELSLIVPVSFVTLSNVEGRHLLASAFSRVRETVLKGVICEICDIEAVPHVALVQASSLIKPHTLFVIGHLQAETPQALGSLKETGLKALSLQCPANIVGDAEFIGWLRSVITSTRRVSKSLMLYGCPNPRRAALAALVGATHVSFRAT